MGNEAPRQLIHWMRQPRTHMKNPLDSLWGTIISGVVLTLVLYLIVKVIVNR